MKKGCTPSCQVLKGPLKNIMQRRWQVGEELRGGGEPVFVTCSLPRLPVACTSLGLRNAGKMSKERGVGRQVRCFAEVWLGEAGPRGKWRQGKRRGKGSKSSTLGAVAQVGWDPKTRGSKQEPRRRGRQSPGSFWLATRAGPNYLWAPFSGTGLVPASGASRTADIQLNPGESRKEYPVSLPSSSLPAVHAIGCSQ